MIAARQIFLGRGGAKLPYDAEVEYLESTGTQYIDTGVVPKSTIGAKIQFELTNPTSDRAILMDGGDAAGFRWGFSSIYKNTIQVSGINANGMTWNNYSLPTGTNEVKYNYTNDKCCYLNGTLIRDNIPYGDIARTSTIWLNASYNAGVSSPWRVNSMKVYSLQMIDNGVLVRDFIPVRIGSEGAMYDRVSGQLFRNAGTGAFNYGNDK